MAREQEVSRRQGASQLLSRSHLNSSEGRTVHSDYILMPYLQVPKDLGRCRRPPMSYSIASQDNGAFCDPKASTMALSISVAAARLAAHLLDGFIETR